MTFFSLFANFLYFFKKKRKIGEKAEE